jgi:phage shock protein C
VNKKHKQRKERGLNVSKSDRERRDAERAARRANRLAQRAQQRAERKEEQAEHATERADRLAERANRRPKRPKELDESIEDLVDQVTEKWTRKAEEWIDGQSSKLYEEDEGLHDDGSFSDKDSNLDNDMDDENFEEEYSQEKPRRRSSRGSRRSKRTRKNKWKYGYNWDPEKWRFKSRHGRRSGNLYRDKRKGKICGVCAGSADYLGMETWQVRLIAVLGLIFIPSVAVTVYFITYFLMDDKPYYRQVTDRFDDRKDHYDEEPRSVKRSKRAPRGEQRESPGVKVSNQEAMKKAKEKFGDIENRLRSMESHVTSSTFELQRELKKISGDDT